jgi:hypothetical protein
VCAPRLIPWADVVCRVRYQRYVSVQTKSTLSMRVATFYVHVEYTFKVPGHIVPQYTCSTALGVRLHNRPLVIGPEGTKCTKAMFKRAAFVPS